MFRRVVSAAAMALLLVACAKSAESPQPVEKAADATTIALHFTAAQGLNPGANGMPAPVRVRIFELKNTAGFSRADGIEPIVKASSKPLIVAGHPGTTDYFVLLAFSQAIGIVPEFRTFQSPRRMVRALIDGEVALAEVSPGAAKAAVADGTFRVLGVTANQRLSELPSVPTLEEQGVGFVYNIERGLFAPAGTPSAIREAIAGNIAAILADPGLETILAEKITRPAYLGPAEFAARLAKSVEAWRTVADRAGLLKR